MSSDDINNQDLGTIDFGKHNGKKWIELPKNYLIYLTMEECQTSEENKKKAKIALWQINQKEKKIQESQLGLFDG